jgi:sulfite reductase beta subunit-like hemoprotein
MDRGLSHGPRASEQTLQLPSWEEVLKRNSVERIKREKFPLDVIRELPELIKTGYEAIPEEDILRLQWWGLYHDKPKLGYFMMRIKVPGGLLAPHQLRAMGEISKRHGRGYGEISTRQNIQLHWIRLDDLPATFDHLGAHGLTTAGGCGDTVRNITGCPVAGIAREELFDTRSVIQEAARFFYGNREYSDLPRKHKYTISACPYQCSAPEIHCVALIGVLKDGREGFAVRIGGGLSVQPRISRDMGVWVPLEDTVEVLKAVTGVWKDNPRYRLSRAKARLKFMVDDYGPDEVRRMVEDRLGRTLEPFTAPAPTGETDHLGVHPQKQPGMSYVGFPVPIGWMSGEQMMQVADVIEQVGADVRLTRQQNFIVGNVPDDKVEWLTRAIAGAGFSPTTNRLYGVSIGCTGEPFCNYSVTETKGKLREILERLEAAFGEEVSTLKVHLDGCPHACAKHWVGDIGLQGTSARTSTGQRTQAYDIFLRGGLGTRTAIAKQLIRRVPSERVTEHLERLVGAWLAEKRARNGHGFSFRDFCDGHSDEELKAIAQGPVNPAAMAVGS